LTLYHNVTISITMSHEGPNDKDLPKDEPASDDKAREERARKEKVLHTRIPASLEEEIKRLADALAIPVSNLVRNILQDTVGMVGTVADRVGGVVTGLRDDAKTLSSHVVADRDNLRRRWADFQARQTRAQEEEAPEAGGGAATPPEAPATHPALDGIFGWQPLTLNIETSCALCARELARGAEAFLGLGDDPRKRIFICPGCLPRA
jgi:hypothetical protein